MPFCRTFLQCLLLVAFCLNGSLSLLRGANMAHGDAHTVPASGETTTLAEEACDEVATEGQALSGHKDCDCGFGTCCSCVFSFYAIAHVAPLPAQRLLPRNEAVPPLNQVVPIGPSRLFRPPIG